MRKEIKIYGVLNPFLFAKDSQVVNNEFQEFPSAYCISLI